MKEGILESQNSNFIPISNVVKSQNLFRIRMKCKIPISYQISKIPDSNGVKYQNPNYFFPWNPKVPNWSFRTLPKVWTKLLKDVWYSKAQKMLKFTFNALIPQQYLLWLRPLHTAEKQRPTMFHTATVRPKWSGPSILYNTPLNDLSPSNYTDSDI